MATRIKSWERRRSFRVVIPGTASVWQGKRFGGFYTVSDLSLGGCCLRDGPTCAFEEAVDVMLHAHELELLQVPAKIVRHTPVEVALRFVEAPSWIEDRLHDVIVASLEAQRGIRPLRRPIEPPIDGSFDPQNDHRDATPVSLLIA